MSQQAPGLVTRGLHPPITTQDGIDWPSLTFPSKADVVYPDYWEQKTIKAKPPNGYNQTKGGEAPMLGKIHSEAARVKMSFSRTGKTPSEETRFKMSFTKKGHSVSEATRAKLSTVGKGRKRSEATRARMRGNKNHLGYKHSDETRLKMSVSAKIRCQKCA